MLHFSKIMCIFAAEINVLTMKHYKTLWLLLMMMVGGLAMTSCSDKDDQESSGGGGEEVKNYVERMYPVVDPKENSQGTVTLRFYNDMPYVAYINVSNFQEMIYPGTTKCREPQGRVPVPRPAKQRNNLSASPLVSGTVRLFYMSNFTRSRGRFL